MASVGELLTNPDFAALSPEAKSIVFAKLAERDAEFSKLSPKAQTIVRAELFKPPSEEPTVELKVIAAAHLDQIHQEQAAGALALEQAGLPPQIVTPGTAVADVQLGLIGLAQGTVGFAADVAAKLSRIVGNPEFAEKLDRKNEQMAVLAEYLSDGSTAGIVAQQVGQNLPIGLGAVSAGKNVFKTGVRLLSRLPAAAVGGGIGAALSSLEVFGAKDDEARAAAIHELPKQLIMNIAAGVALGGGNARMRKAAAKQVVAEVPVVSQRLLGPGVYEMPASARVPGATSMEQAGEFAARTSAELLEAGKIEEGMSWAQDAVDLGVKLDPIGDAKLRIRQLEEAHQVAGDAVAAAQERLPWVVDERLNSEARSPLLGLQDALRKEKAEFDRVSVLRQAGKVDEAALGVQRRTVEAIEAQIDGLRRARKISPEETVGGQEAVEQFNAARQARLAVEHELDIADSYLQELKNLDVRPSTSTDTVPFEESVPRGTSTETAKPTIKTEAKKAGKTRARAEKLGQDLADKVFTERRRNAIENAVGMDGNEVIRRVTERLARGTPLAANVTEADLQKISPPGQQVLGAIARMWGGVRLAGAEIHRMLSEHVAGNAQFIEQKILSYGAFIERKNLIVDLANKMRELIPSDLVDQLLRFAFDPKGIEKIHAVNLERLRAGEPPIWTAAHEALVRDIHELTDMMWGEQVVLGLIDADQFRINYLPQMFNNPKLAAAYFKAKLVGKSSPFSFAREFQSLYDAVEQSDGKLTLRFGRATEALPHLLGTAAQSIYDGRVRLAAMKIPGAWLTASEFAKIPFKDKAKGEYVRINTGDYVRQDVFDGARYEFKRLPDDNLLVNKTWALSKQAVLSIDYQHVVQTFRAVATHPRALLNPIGWSQALTGRLLATERLQNYVRIGGGNLSMTGGDYIRNVGEYFGGQLLPKEAGIFEKILRGSHHFVFEQVVPIQKALVAFTELERVFRQRARAQLKAERGRTLTPGERLWKDATDTEIYQRTAERVENEFGNPDMRRLGLDPKTIKYLRMALLAPEWNLSILRSTLHAGKELATAVTGGATDFYHSKRMLGYLVTGLIGTAVANLALSNLLKGTEHETGYKGIGEDPFTIVLPWKNKFTGKNIRLYTLGPQLEFWKLAVDLADHAVNYAKGGTWWDIGKAAMREVAGFTASRVHPVVQAVAGATERRAFERENPFTKVMPFSFPDAAELAKELYSTGGHATPEAWLRVGTGLVGLRMHWDVPQLVIDDFQVTSADVNRLRKESYIKAANGMQEMAADKAKEAYGLIEDFNNRYKNSKHYDLIAPYVRRLMAGR